jgi:hypothetical protein
MRRLHISRWLLLAMTALVFGWPAYQVYDWMKGRTHHHGAEVLLYQVGAFQVELLGSLLNDSAQSTAAEKLDALKQAAYTASYTHERMTAAFGPDRLTDIACFSQLLQYIMRLQIGGPREIRPDEAETLKEAALSFKELQETYRGLLASDGTVIASQNERLKEADKTVTELLRKKQLE